MQHKIGLVGTGGIAAGHAEGYGRVLGDRAVLAAACDPDGDRLKTFCDRSNIQQRFTDPNDFFSSTDVNIIALLTPPAVRAEYIYPALERGINVLVEKPFGNSYTECNEYVEAAARIGTKLAVSQNLRFYPDVEWAKEIVSSGILGDLTYIGHDHFQWRMKTGGWRAFEKRLEISMFSIHVLDRIRWMAGLSPRTVSCVTRPPWTGDGVNVSPTGRRPADDRPAGEIFSDLRIEFENDEVGTMTSSWYSRIPENVFRIDGKQGSLMARRQSAVSGEGEGRLVLADGDSRSITFNRPEAGRLAFGYSMKHFIDAIESDTEPLHSGRDNLQTMVIVDAAYLSAARNGTPVQIEEIINGTEN